MSRSRRSTSLPEIEAAYRAHGHHVRRRAALILGDEVEAGEVVQEVFLNLVDHPEQFTARSALATWLYSATVHRCLNRLRNARTRARVIDAAQRADALPLPRPSASAEQVFELRALLQRLPDDLVQVAVYKLADEMSQDEIAETLGCSRRRVRQLLERLELALAHARQAAS